METATIEDTKAARRPRYDCYHPSGIDWLGEIPAHWETKPLKFTVSIDPQALSEKTDGDYYRVNVQSWGKVA